MLQAAEYSRLDKILISLACAPETPRAVGEIRGIAVENGLRAAARWNLAAILGASSGLAVRTKAGWELSAKGRQRVADLVGPSASSPLPAVASSVRSHLAGIKSANTKEFLEEAIRCLESGLLRAATVLSWVGALNILYERVVATSLPQFNKEALRRDSKWKAAATVDDLARMKEHDFLQVLEAISIVGKSVKHELEACLKRRNGAGHPNSLKIGDAMVAAHIETLAINVFSVF